MTSTHIALLRAVNVGGTGKLTMEDLRTICLAAGFSDPQTYIASGNVLFESALSAEAVKAALEARLATCVGKPVGVIVRSPAQMRSTIEANPFSSLPGNRVLVVFLDAAPPTDALARATGVNGEEMRLGEREIYVHYPQGQGNSKLRLQAAASGTARNINTVEKLARIAEERVAR